MGATVQDVWRDFIDRTEGLPNVVAYLIGYDLARNRLGLTTLLDEPDVAAERELATIELTMEQQYQEQPMEFSSVHLRGRDPEAFALEEDPSATLFRRRSARRSADAQ